MVEQFSLSLETPLSTAAGEIGERRGFALRVGDGVGEATPLPGWTESFEECQETLADVEGADPDAALAGLEDHPAARHGLSLALADRDAREEGFSLARHLSAAGEPNEPVEELPVNATIGDAPAEESVEAARDAVAEGFGTVKCKVGARSVEEDVARVRAVRGAVGAGPAIRLDANGGWSREAAERALDSLAEFDVEYVEQPLPADDIVGHHELSSSIPIALDESLAGRPFERIEALAGAADVFVLKPIALGGVDRAIELGRRLRAKGAGIVVTTTIDAVIARTAAVHAAAALDPDHACGLATADLLAEDLAPDPAPVADGSITVPRGPGLGTDGPWSTNGGGRDA